MRCVPQRQAIWSKCLIGPLLSFKRPGLSLLLHIAVARPNSPVRKDKVLESCFSVVSVRTVAAGKLSFGHPEAFFFFLKLLHGRSRFRSSRFRRFLGDLFATASAESATCGLNTTRVCSFPRASPLICPGRKQSVSFVARRIFCRQRARRGLRCLNVAKRLLW